MKNITTRLLYLFLFITFFSCKSEDQQIADFVTLFNANCPQKTNEVRIDGASLSADRTVTIQITLLRQVDDHYINNYGSVLKKGLYDVFLNTIGTDSKFDNVKELGITFIIKVVDTTEQPITEFSIKAEEYNKKNKFSEMKATDTVDESNIAALMTATANNMKAALPITDPKNGIIAVDCYYENNQFINVGVVPDSYLEDMTQESFYQKRYDNIISIFKSKESMQAILKLGVVAKYIYKLENGEIYSEIIISADSLK